MNNNATTKPGLVEPTSEAEHLEINSKAGQEDTSREPDQEAAATEPGEEKMNPEPEYEKIKPRPDLKKIFAFEGGYGKPPRNRQFKKGTSGNPDGRPPGAKNKPKPLNDKNLTEILRSEFYREVRVNGGPTVPAATAITRRLVDLAVGGDMRAIKFGLTSLHAADAAYAAQKEAEYNYWLKYANDLKNDPMRTIYDPRQPVPDPKDIVFNHVDKRVLFTGPRNEEEMFEYLAGRDFRVETTDEEEEESENVEVADECPDERHCPPWSPRDPNEPEDPRLRRTAPEDEDERLRKPAPNEHEDERLRKPAPDDREDERLRKPAPDDREDERLRKPAPDEHEDERLRKPAA